MVRVRYRNSYEKPRIGNVVSFPGDNKVYEILDVTPDGQACLSRVKKLPSQQYPSAGYKSQIVLPLDEEMVLVARGDNRPTYEEALLKEQLEAFKALPKETQYEFERIVRDLDSIPIMEDKKAFSDRVKHFYSLWFKLERKVGFPVMMAQVRELIK